MEIVKVKMADEILDFDIGILWLQKLIEDDEDGLGNDVTNNGDYRNEDDDDDHNFEDYWGLS